MRGKGRKRGTPPGTQVSKPETAHRESPVRQSPDGGVDQREREVRRRNGAAPPAGSRDISAKNDVDMGFKALPWDPLSPRPSVNSREGTVGWMKSSFHHSNRPCPEKKTELRYRKIKVGRLARLELQTEIHSE